jgi:hypothetical protein
MTHRMALLASLMLVAAVPSGAQTPASSAPAESATSSAKPSSSAASSSTTAPAAADTASTVGTASAATASKPASSATDASSSSEPSPEVLKEARREGFKPKKRNGVTQFCQTSPQMNTHFQSETCVDAAQLKMLVEQREDQRNQLSQHGACTGCNGH